LLRSIVIRCRTTFPGGPSDPGPVTDCTVSVFRDEGKDVSTLDSNPARGEAHRCLTALNSRSHPKRWPRLRATWR
jgi:hypothetical protein